MDKLEANASLTEIPVPKKAEAVATSDGVTAARVEHVVRKSEFGQGPSICPPTPLKHAPGVFFNYNTQTWYRGYKQDLMPGSHQSSNPERTFPAKGLKDGKVVRYKEPKRLSKPKESRLAKLEKQAQRGNEKAMRAAEALKFAFRNLLGDLEKRVVTPSDVKHLESPSKGK